MVNLGTYVLSKCWHIQKTGYETAKGLGWKVAGKERETRNLREPHPDSRHPRPAPCSQGR